MYRTDLYRMFWHMVHITSKATARLLLLIRSGNSPYIQMAEDRKSRIKYVLETHFHADFVSDHVDLAQKTGATIVWPHHYEDWFDMLVATDGQEFELGNIRIRLLHTPGHQGKQLFSADR